LESCGDDEAPASRAFDSFERDDAPFLFAMRWVHIFSHSDLGDLKLDRACYSPSSSTRRDVIGEADNPKENAMDPLVHPPRESGAPMLFSREPRSLTAAASAHLDMVRALAASAVMWGHLRGLFLVSFQHIEHPGALLKMIYFVTGFGNEAVLVFFVLSGFLISSAIMKRLSSNTWSWRDYTIDRLSRLYVVLIPGLLFGLLWDQAGSSFFASTGLYTHPIDSFGSTIARNGITPGTFLGNIFFLQTIVCPVFGSNGPLWSLANEFWYYVLFPLALFASLAWKDKLTTRAMVLTMLGTGAALFITPGMRAGFLIWLAGSVLIIAYSRVNTQSKEWRLPYLVISFFLFAGSLVGARNGGPSWLGSDLAVGCTFALFLFGVLHAEFRLGSSLYPKIAHLFAVFSYSLYVLHFPLLLFLRAWLVPAKKWQPDTPHIVYCLLIGAAMSGFAWLVSTVTENNTRLVRHWMRSAILPAGDASV